MRKAIAIMTGGGDAPGLNAVIRAVVKRGVTDLGWRVVGIEDSFDGLLGSPQRIHELDRNKVRGILRLGGTILGTTNHGNPFSWSGDGGEPTDRSHDLAKALEYLGVEGLIGVGGDGTIGICWRLMKERGINVVAVPKTIDNDIPGTDVTFGFDSASSYATDAVDRLHLTAESHDRVMVIEVMGRNAGFIALHAGMAGGADAILLPEIPFDLKSVAAKVMRRKASQRHFSIVVVAEGAHPAGGDKFFTEIPGGGKMNLGGVGFYVAEALAQMTGVEARCTVLGHLLRGGSPTSRDRILATRFGSKAIDLIQAGQWGEMAAVVGGHVGSVPLEKVAGLPARTVDLDCDMMRSARGLGIIFGDES